MLQTESGIDLSDARALFDDLLVSYRNFHTTWVLIIPLCRSIKILKKRCALRIQV